MNTENPSIILEKQRKFFKSNRTLDINFRINVLKKLKNIIIENDELIYKALKKDLNKSKFESYISEVGFVISEINYTIRNIKSWSKVEKS